MYIYTYMICICVCVYIYIYIYICTCVRVRMYKCDYNLLSLCKQKWDELMRATPRSFFSSLCRVFVTETVLTGFPCPMNIETATRENCACAITQLISFFDLTNAGSNMWLKSSKESNRQIISRWSERAVHSSRELHVVVSDFKLHVPYVWTRTLFRLRCAIQAIEGPHKTLKSVPIFGIS